MTTRELWADDEVDEAPPQLDDFPTLGEAAKAPASQQKAQGKKKNKPAKMSLAELNAMAGPGGRGPMGRSGFVASDKEILAQLPTSSRGKVEGEEDDRAGKLGGGFGNYGGDRGGGFNRREEGGRGPRPGREDWEGFQPSRADTVDDWGSTRQFQASHGDSRGPRGPPRGDREPRPYSAADEVDDWGSTRKFEPSAGDDRRGGFGGAGGFREAPARRGMFDNRPISRADEEDQWSRGRDFQQGERAGARERSGSRNFGFGGDARGPAGGEDRWTKKAPEPAAEVASPEQPQAPAERRKLNLAPRTLPVEKPPAPAPTPVAEDKPKPAAAEDKPKANPFGTAKPREEAGSWRKPLAEVAASQAADSTTSSTTAAAAAPSSQEQPAEATSLPAVILETPAERELKAVVAKLRARLDELTEDADVDADDIAEARAELEAEEARLAQLQAEREEMERQAAAAGDAEDDGSWVPASKASKAAAAPAAAKEAPPRAERTSPSGGGRGGRRRESDTAGGWVRQGRGPGGQGGLWRQAHLGWSANGEVTNVTWT